MKKKTVFDVEVSPTKSMVGFMDVESGEIRQFEHNEGDDIAEYIKDRILIGFNSLNYDNIILSSMIKGKTAKQIYAISFDLIEDEGKRWDYEDLIKDSIDLMEVAPGQASLKLYGSRLNAKKLQDLPYHHHDKHTKKMWKDVCKYNKNDLKLTKLLYDSLIQDLEIRENIGNQYGIDVRSRSDAQVAEDVFKKVLGFKKKPKIDMPKSVTYKAPKYIKFRSRHLNEIKNKFESSEFKINYKTGNFIPQSWLKDKVMIDGTPYTIGYGGLHSNESRISVKCGLRNADIASMYPSLIINSGKYPTHLGEKWLKMYTEFRDKRMEIKHTDKKLSAMLKIFLNGVYGKLNSHYSILYAPHLMLDTTITGQLSLLMVIEALTDAGIKVVSANTDGVEYVDDGSTKGQEIIDELGLKMNLVWEHASYKALYSRDVNSYVAVYDDHVKAKGFYGEQTLQKNIEYPIVTEAIRQFLFDGTAMEDTIKNCKEPAQFCIARQVTGGALWSPEEYPNTEEFDDFIVKFEAGKCKDNKALRKRNENYQKEFVLAESKKWYLGKVVRYYYATDGKPLFYAKSGNRVPKSDGGFPMMKLKKKIPKNLDYDKYIELAYTHLKETGWTE